MKDWSAEGRLERDARARRARAEHHLSKLRGHGHAEPRRRVTSGAPRVVRLAPRVALVACGAAALLGACAGRVAMHVGSGSALDAIAVRGVERLTPTEVAAATGVARGTRLGDVDAGAVERALQTHAWIASAHAVRVPGGRLLVEVEERRPLAELRVGERRYAVDEAGVAFAEFPYDEQTSLPRLVASGAAGLHEPDALRVEAARLPERMQQLGLAAPDEVRVAAPGDPEGVSLRLPGLAGVVVLGRESFDARLRDLARLIESQPEATARAARIDLRFADQAVLRSEAAREGSQAAVLRGGGAPRSTPTTG
jgi:cell division septal protein FtsQ